MPRKKIRESVPLPARSKEWEEGWKAFQEGKEKHENPYMADKEMLKYNRWARGWDAHYYQNAK